MKDGGEGGDGCEDGDKDGGEDGGEDGGGDGCEGNARETFSIWFINSFKPASLR